MQNKHLCEYDVRLYLQIPIPDAVTGDTERYHINYSFSPNRLRLCYLTNRHLDPYR